VGGMEIRGTGKFDGTSTTRRASFPILKSCKVEGKLLITLKLIKIM
jgi:hypothetical protein